MIDAPSIQWFPGHMAKTRRLIGESLSLVDLVIELTDARIPQSSRNPELDKWLSDKPRIIILNKSDCADENITKQWVEYYKKKGIRAVMADCKSGKGVAGIIPAVKAELTELLERRAAKMCIRDRYYVKYVLFSVSADGRE